MNQDAVIKSPHPAKSLKSLHVELCISVFGFMRHGGHSIKTKEWQTQIEAPAINGRIRLSPLNNGAMVRDMFITLCRSNALNDQINKQAHQQQWCGHKIKLKFAKILIRKQLISVTSPANKLTNPIRYAWNNRF